MKSPIFPLLFLSSLLFSCGTPSNPSSSEDPNWFPTEGLSPNEGERVDYVSKPSSLTGSMIRIQEIYASSELFSVENLIDDSGMSGSGSELQSHSAASPRDTMFLSDRGQTSGSLILKLEGFHRLGHLRLWNFSQASKLDCGSKDIEIFYSDDGIQFRSLGTHVLDRGNDSSSLIDGQPYFDFGGIKAQFIRLNVLSNYGGNQFGLSEIRLFEYVDEKNPSIQSWKDANSPLHSPLFTGTALDQNGSKGKLSNNPYYQTKTKKNALTVHLDGQFEVSQVSFWNYNDPTDLNSGVSSLRLLGSVDDVHYEEWGTYSLPKGTGLNAMPVSYVASIESKKAQYLKFEFLSNYGGEGYGLGAIALESDSKPISRPMVNFTGQFSSYSSWSGADGVFSTRLDGYQAMNAEPSKTIFHFSDTYYGEVNPVTKQRVNNKMVNNSFAYLENEKMNFVGNMEGIPLLATKDSNRSEADAFYWLGDSFVINQTYYVFGLYIAKEGPLGFNQVGEDLFAFDIQEGQVDFASKRLIYDTSTNHLSYFDSANQLSVILGSGVFENTIQSGALNPDGYVYIYGYRDDKKIANSRSLVVARVRQAEVENYSSYRYWDGANWVEDISKLAPLTDHGNVSCELSVSEINDKTSPYYGKYILVYQDATIGKDVCYRLSSSPFGLFDEKKVLYHCEESTLMNGVSQYNAKAHPVLSRNGSIVVSYNLNESTFGMNDKNGDIYHPRFVEFNLL